MGSTTEELQLLGTVSSVVGMAAGILGGIGAAVGFAAFVGGGGIQS
ncbi:hypothetical protein [Rhodococcus triatomae]